MLAHIVANSVELCKFITRLRLTLSKPQMRHVINVADALIVSEARRKSLAALHRELLDPPSDQYALADCFRASPWRRRVSSKRPWRLTSDWSLARTLL